MAETEAGLDALARAGADRIMLDLLIDPGLRQSWSCMANAPSPTEEREANAATPSGAVAALCTKLGLATATGESESGWIKYSERKPTEGQFVCIWVVDRGFYAHFYGGRFTRVGQFYPYDPGQIQLWCPMPAPPSPETNGDG